FARVRSADLKDDEARMDFILYKLIPAYVERLPQGADGMAIRELLACRDADGQAQSLATRYRKASKHIFHGTKDFGRRQEPRLLLECARYFIRLDYEDLTPAPDVVAGRGSENLVIPDVHETPPLRGDGERKRPDDPSVGIEA